MCRTPQFRRPVCQLEFRSLIELAFEHTEGQSCGVSGGPARWDLCEGPPVRMVPTATALIETSIRSRTAPIEDPLRTLRWSGGTEREPAGEVVGCRECGAGSVPGTRVATTGHVTKKEG